MNEQTKIKRALESLPYEVLTQWSIGTDDTDVLLKNATDISKDEGVSILKIMLEFAEETLSTYEDGGDNRHINYDMRLDDYETWIQERKEIKKYIRKLKSYLK